MPERRETGGDRTMRLSSAWPWSRFGAVTILILLSLQGMPGAGTSGNIDLPGYVGVPVRYGGFNKMLMNATINGHKVTLVIDSGAYVSVLDAARASALGVKPTA